MSTALGYRTFGGADVQEFFERPDPSPGPAEVLIPVAGTTALDVLDQLALPAGASLLVNGIGGGVGIALAQLARDRDLVVVGTGSTAKRDLATRTGATFVDYTAGNVVDRLRAHVPDGFDAVVDTVGGESLRDIAPLAANPETLVSVGDPSVTELGGAAVRRRLDRASLERVAELMAARRLDPHITQTFPLARAHEALALVESRHTSGKLVIDMGL